MVRAARSTPSRSPARTCFTEACSNFFATTSSTRGTSSRRRRKRWSAISSVARSAVACSFPGCTTAGAGHSSSPATRGRDAGRATSMSLLSPRRPSGRATSAVSRRSTIRERPLRIRPAAARCVRSSPATSSRRIGSRRRPSSSIDTSPCPTHPAGRSSRRQSAHSTRTRSRFDSIRKSVRTTGCSCDSAGTTARRRRRVRS